MIPVYYWQRFVAVLVLCLPAGDLQMQIQMIPFPFQMITLQQTAQQQPQPPPPPPQPLQPAAISVPMPMPVQIAIQAQQPTTSCQTRPPPDNCPVCPPCSCVPCTPKFFSYCSPCHQKCRCRNEYDTPAPSPPMPPPPLSGPAFPMPIPAPALVGPPPMVVVPFPSYPQQIPKNDNCDPNDCSCSNYDECVDNRRRGAKRRQLKKRRSYRRSARTDTFETGIDSDFDRDSLEPMLSYVSKDGTVKMEEVLSHDEAEELLDDSNFNNKVHVVRGVDEYDQDTVKVVEKNEYIRPANTYRTKQVALSSGSAHHVLGKGKKELLFKPPGDKKISNLSVSFQIV